MIKGDIKEIIRKAKNDYYRIGSVPCPAFNYELVYFNRSGWNHIIRKGNKQRDTKDQLRRIRLITEAVIIIATSNDFNSHSITENKIEFWSFKKINIERPIIVIIRQDKLMKYFFSVMNR